jgi:hypothetical protein
MCRRPAISPSTNLSKKKIEVGKTEMLSRYLLFSRYNFILHFYKLHFPQIYAQIESPAIKIFRGRTPRQPRGMTPPFRTLPTHAYAARGNACGMSSLRLLPKILHLLTF